jgi:hypothetical protein|tara:strand:+ start:225 stop:419 length:195 start_codon:yes stop_codon:yes gene_type:complete
MNFFERLIWLVSSPKTNEETIEETQESEEEDMVFKVRARNSEGRYVADDPNTKENEAYVVRKTN